MSVEKAKEFLNALKDKEPDEALNEKAAAAKTGKERIAVAAEIAKEMGYDVTGTEIKEAMEALQQDDKDMIPLDDESLAEVAGGSTGGGDYFACPKCRAYIRPKRTGKTDTRWGIFPIEQVECPDCHELFWV